MPIPYKIPIPFYLRRVGGGFSCLTNLLFYQGLYNTEYTQIYDKTELNNDADVLSNCILLNTASTSTFTNDVLLFVTKVEILNSADKVAWTTSIDDETLYTIDTNARTFTIDKLGHYYSRIRLYRDDLVLLDWLLASNDTSEELNKVISEDWQGYINPFSILKKELKMSLTNKVKL